MRHIPNLLSAFRILLIPLFVWLMQAEDTLPAAVVLGVSGITDMLDGYLARRFGWVTQLGKVLDPIADKLTQVTVCVLLAIRFRAYWPLFAVLLLKELLMLVFGGVLMQRGVKLQGARWFGKVGTVLFYVSMVSIVFFPALPDWLVWTLLILTTACSLLAAVLYIPEYRKHRKEN